MVKIFAYKKKEKLSPQTRNALLAFLNLEEKSKVKSFKKETDKETALLSRGLLRKMLAVEIGVRPEKIKFSRSKYERPFLAESKNLDFNVSHSGDWIVWVLASSSRAGIDIEKIRPIEETLVDSCFTKEEKEYIGGNKDFDLEKFFELWTLKEAFIKADGKGLSYPLQDFYFQIDPQIKLQAKFSNQAWYFKQYDLDPDYKMAVCLNQDIFPEAINLIF